MQGSRTVLTVAALVLFAGVAWPVDTFQGGEFSSSGESSKKGTYTATLTVTPDGHGAFHVKENIRYSSGETAQLSGAGRVSGDSLLVSGQTAVGFVGKLVKKHGDSWSATFKIGPDGAITTGSWNLAHAGANASETFTHKTPAAPKGDLLVLVDGDGKDVPAAKKKTDGVLLPVNLGGADLLPFKLVKPKDSPADASFVLAFSGKVAVWRCKERSDGTQVKAGDPLPASDATLYMEGLDASSGGDGETLSVTLQNASGSALLGDAGKVWIARSAFLLLGHGNSGDWSFNSWLDSHKADGRKNPVLVRGKDEKGKPQAWAAYVWNTEKQAKVALSTAGAVIAYDGHSNFGLGYAFETHFTHVSQFMNIADAQVPVNWEYLRDHQDHPDLMFEDSEYGDDASTPEFSDPVAVTAWCQGQKKSYSTSRWPEGGAFTGRRYHLIRGKDYKWQDHHYVVDKDPTNARIVVKAGSADMPEKKWSKLYLNSCYSGPYYYDSFGGRGTLFFTTDESSSSKTSALFLEGCIQGQSNDAILKSLNKAENINDYHVFGE